MHDSALLLLRVSAGKGLDLVRMFYNLLPQRHRWVDKQREMAEFVIDETFGVPGVGTVVAGTVKRGVITPNTTLLLGETGTGRNGISTGFSRLDPPPSACPHRVLSSRHNASHCY